MIRHVVLFTLKDRADLDRAAAALRRLAAIPHAQRLEVAPNACEDSLSDEIDLVVYGEFADAQDLRAYKAHPLYAETVRRVRPLRERRIAVDYVVPAGR